VPNQDHQNQFESGFYRDGSGGLLLVDRNGKTVKLDFDVDKLNLQKNEESTIKNNIENESDMNLEKPSESEDLTPKQLEENYWLETEATKLDGSTAMMEKRISGCMEATGKTREECSKEVKARMKKAGSDNTNTTDTSNVKDEENVEEEDEEEDKKEDTIEICAKEFDMLKEKAERLDTIEAELEVEKNSTLDMKEKFKEMKIVCDTIQSERKAELEIKRQEKIKQLTTDYDLSEESFQDRDIKRLEEDMALLKGAVKINAEEDNEEVFEIDMDDLESDFTKRSKALDEMYKIKAVK